MKNLYRKYPFIGFISITLLILSYPKLMISQTEEEEILRIQSEILKIEEQIAEEKELHSRDIDDAGVVEDNLKGRILSLNEDIDSLGKERMQKEKTIRDLEKEIKDIEKEIKLLNEVIADISRGYQQEASKLYRLIETDIPINRERRMKDILDLIHEMKEEGELIEDLRRVFYYYEREVKLGFSSDVHKDHVITEGGKLKGARVMRLGAVYGTYVTEDGDEAGILSFPVNAQDGHKWDEEVHFFLRRRLSKAMDMMEGKSVPHLVNLPLKGTYQPDKMSNECEVSIGE